MSITIGPVTTKRGRGWRLEAEMRLPRPLEEVFDFFSRAENLERITPDVVRFRILTPLPIEMRRGAIINYALSVRGIPVRWRTEISVWEPPAAGGSTARFVDQQLRGPYRWWVHEHLFEADGVETIARDVVDYGVPGGPLAPLVNALVVQRDVRSIFEYRATTLRELFPTRPDPAEQVGSPSVHSLA